MIAAKQAEVDNKQAEVEAKEDEIVVEDGLGNPTAGLELQLERLQAENPISIGLEKSIKI